MSGPPRGLSGDQAQRGRHGGASSAARTDVGLIRKLNEDCFVDRPDIGLWAVADGMGGHSRGDVASGMIQDALAALPPFADVPAGLAALKACLVEVHGRLRQLSRTGLSGSTVVTLVLADSTFGCLWVGDSRLYRLRGRQLEALTTDHSLVQELVATGTLTPEMAFRHPLSNRITRAVGIGDPLEPDLAQGEAARGDRFLLSSDGLHGVVPEGVIAELAALPDLDQAAEALVTEARREGAPDNVTVVLVQAG